MKVRPKGFVCPVVSNQQPVKICATLRLIYTTHSPLLLETRHDSNNQSGVLIGLGWLILILFFRDALTNP